MFSVLPFKSSFSWECGRDLITKNQKEEKRRRKESKLRAVCTRSKLACGLQIYISKIFNNQSSPKFFISSPDYVSSGPAGPCYAHLIRVTITTCWKLNDENFLVLSFSAMIVASSARGMSHWTRFGASSILGLHPASRSRVLACSPCSYLTCQVH